jgi:Cu-Zn family superoxide dismutase
MKMRAILAILAGGTLLTGLTACSGEAAQPQDKLFPVAQVSFAAPSATGAQPGGVTYQTEQVPVGAKATVSTKTDGMTTKISLAVEGLMPNHQYGSHVHTKPCGAKPADSGPHYQDKKDPISPSVDPAYANAQNEIWLDFSTDAKGAATTTATANWLFRKGEANAVVLHASQTSTEHGKAGTAGDRLACVAATF